MRSLSSGARVLALIWLGAQFASASWGQAYPAKPVRLIAPVSAGSGTDTIARIVASGLTEVFSQQFIVDNRAGAAGNIGTEFAARAPPDGYTILFVNMANAANVSLYRNLSFDLIRDFAPVTQLATGPAAVVVHPSLPVRSIGELVRLAKAKPGAINYSSGGAGTATFLSVELFKSQARVDLMHVPYKAGGEALTAVIAGEVSVYFPPVAAALQQIRQGRLRALAITSAQRLTFLPEYPTVAESGLPGYEFGNWYGLSMPAKTPKEAVTTLHQGATSALRNPTVSKRLGELGYILVGDQPEEFAAYIRSEVAKLAKVITALKLTAD